jgi:hypothetical protein
MFSKTSGTAILGEKLTIKQRGVKLFAARRRVQSKEASDVPYYSIGRWRKVA